MGAAERFKQGWKQGTKWTARERDRSNGTMNRALRTRPFRTGK